MGLNRGDREGAWWNRDDRKDRDKFFGCQKICHDYADLTLILRERDRAWESS